MIRWLIPFLLVLATGQAIAFEHCFADAAKAYGVNPLLLKAIAQKESGLQPTIVRKNKNGSEDIGLMQINSSWLGSLGKYGITKDTLMDPCVNVATGAWILSNLIAKHGWTWDAVGRYHSGTPGLREAYGESVRQRVVALITRG